jgi:hypothetical protein
MGQSGARKTTLGLGGGRHSTVPSGSPTTVLSMVLNRALLDMKD